MIKKLTLIQVVLLLFLLLQGISLAQDWQVGVEGGYHLFNTAISNSQISGLSNTRLPLTLKSNQNNPDYAIRARHFLFDKIFGEIRLQYIPYGMTLGGEETITVIKDGKPVKGTIVHDISTTFGLTGLEVSAGYNFFDNFDLSIGSSFLIPTKKSFNHRQTLTNPEGFEIPEIVANTSGDVQNTASVLILPFARLAFNSPMLSFKRLRLIPEVGYSFSLNKVAQADNWKISGVSAGISLVYDFYKFSKIVLSDTAISRDTLRTFSEKVNDSLTNLVDRSIHIAEKEDTKAIYRTYTIAEKYEVLLPYPKAILNGELKTTFITEKGDEESECKIIIKEKISDIYIANAEQSKGTFYRNSDTIVTLKLPRLRFYPSIISEAGLDKWSIRISSGSKVLKTISGKGETSQFYEVALDSIIKYPNMKSLNYEMVIQDINKQSVKISSGTVVFKNEGRKEPPQKSEYFFIPSNTKDLTKIKSALSKSKSSDEISSARVFFLTKATEGEQKCTKLATELNIPTPLTTPPDAFIQMLKSKGKFKGEGLLIVFD